MGLSKLQKEITYSKANNIIVLASAAAGKTAVLTERVKWLLEQGVKPEKIVVFTFTNAAAEEMRKRIGDKGKDVFINTVHSYAFNLLLKYGLDVGKVAADERFDDFFKMVKDNPGCVEEVEHLLLDEAQDSNLLQFKFIFDMIKPKHAFIVGDIKQSIYEWSGARPDILFNLLNDPRFEVYHLNENYRNGPTILRFAKKLISGSVFGDEPLIDNSICMNEFEPDQVAEVTYNKENLAFLIKQSGSYGKWFVLARSNTQIDVLMDSLTKMGIPCDTFKRSQITAEEFQTKMAADTVKILTVHAAKGLEADYVYVVGVSKWNQKAEERRIAYVAATRAKKALFWSRDFKKKKQQVSNWE